MSPNSVLHLKKMNLCRHDTYLRSSLKNAVHHFQNELALFFWTSFASFQLCLDKFQKNLFQMLNVFALVLQRNQSLRLFYRTINPFESDLILLLERAESWSSKEVTLAWISFQDSCGCHVKNKFAPLEIASAETGELAIPSHSKNFTKDGAKHSRLLESFVESFLQ
jgi:hypothetical protein